MLKSLSFLACVSLGAGALAFVNPGFDDPAPPTASYIRYIGGASGLTGWNVLGTAILHLHFQYNEGSNGMPAFNAHASVGHVDLTGAGNEGTTAGVSQTVATVPGVTYGVQFYLGRARSSTNSGFYSSPAVLDVSIDGGTRVSYTNDQETPLGQVIWLPRWHTFTATSTSTNIAFFNGTGLGSCNYVGLDSVQLVVVPEPTSVLSLGLAAFVLMRRRR